MVGVFGSFDSEKLRENFESTAHRLAALWIDRVVSKGCSNINLSYLLKFVAFLHLCVVSANLGSDYTFDLSDISNWC